MDNYIYVYIHIQQSSQEDWTRWIEVIFSIMIMELRKELFWEQGMAMAGRFECNLSTHVFSGNVPHIPVLSASRR